MSNYYNALVVALAQLGYVTVSDNYNIELTIDYAHFNSDEESIINTLKTVFAENGFEPIIENLPYYASYDLAITSTDFSKPFVVSVIYAQFLYFFKNHDIITSNQYSFYTDQFKSYKEVLYHG